jgi:hypothetical protein
MRIREIILEAEAVDITGRTPHPEDAIFDGSQHAARMIQALNSVIKNPGSLTIKWDGFPALIFGRLPDGQFTVMDKYMYDNPQGRITSAQGWVDYDTARGKPRPDLYPKIAHIWAGLEQAVGSSPGFYWGDLLWSDPLTPAQGKFVFRPNPWGVTYSIDTNSDLGKQIAGRQGGIVVHTFIPSDGAQPQPWNGQGLNMNTPVAVLTPSANIAFTLKDPVKLRNTASAVLQKNGALADQFMAGLDDKGRMAVKQYANKLITKQTNDSMDKWIVNANFSQKLKKFLLGENKDGYLYQNSKGLDAIFAIWNAIYAFKINVTEQLEKQVKGIDQSINGQPAGEGFVFSTPQGPVKLVNRGVFSAALFARGG